MNVIYSIHRRYSEKIFSGEKDIEFRNIIGKDIYIGDMIYFYETKNKGGASMVIGSAKIKDIITIPYHKVGTYFLLPYYVEKYGTEEDKKTVKHAMEIKLDHYDESIVLNYLYDEKSLNYMSLNNDVPNVLKTMFRGYSIDQYNALCDRADQLCKSCDNWASRIGYYNEDKTSYWKYAIVLENPVKFKTGKPICYFKNRNGETIKKAPQGWCYTID